MLCLHVCFNDLPDGVDNADLDGYNEELDKLLMAPSHRGLSLTPRSSNLARLLQPEDQVTLYNMDPVKHKSIDSDALSTSRCPSHQQSSCQTRAFSLDRFLNSAPRNHHQLAENLTHVTSSSVKDDDCGHVVGTDGHCGRPHYLSTAQSMSSECGSESAHMSMSEGSISIVFNENIAPEVCIQPSPSSHRSVNQTTIKSSNLLNYKLIGII